MALSVESLVLEVGRALAPLEQRLRAGEIPLLFAELGLPAPDTVLGSPGVGTAIEQAADALAALPDTLADLAAALDSADPLEIARAGARVLPLVDTASAAIDAIGAAIEAAADGDGEIEAFAAELVERLFGFALAIYLERRRPVVAHLFLLLGILEVTAHAATRAAPAHVRRVLRFDRFAALVDDPAAVLGEVYGWGGPDFDWDELLVRLGVFLDRVSTFAFVQPGEPPFLRVALVDIGVTDHEVPGVQAVLRVEAPDGLDQALPLSDRVALTASAEGALELGSAVQLLPPADLRLVPPESAAEGRLQFGVRAAGSPLVVLGAPGSSRVEARTLRAAAGADLTWNAPEGRADGELNLEAALEGGKAVLTLAGADGFLSSVLPRGPQELDVDLLVRWSSETGLHLQGAAGLHMTRGVHRQAGPVRLETLDVDFAAAADALTAKVMITGAVALGPVTATVQQVGTEVVLRNLVPLDASADFVPPTGLGLAVDAAVATGGGFLAYDRAAAQYAGAVELELSGVALKAFGLLTTRLPGGAPGYSLLIIISAELTPVELGMGFRLVRVGGLLGINRTVAVEPLRAGLKTGALGAILSPPDPKANAGQLIASLSTFFPPAPGRYVLGPTARIVWGSPTLITIDLCLVLELPAPVRLVVLGRLRAVLPEERKAVVVLQMDLLGVIDFDRREAAVDATLVDSRLASFTLTGDMALRMSWGARPSFLLSVGGFHPSFVPPPGFLALERVAVALAAGDNPRLRLEAYLALTSNTVQLGARLDLLARAGRFSLEGMMSFDALVRLRPLAFEVDIAAKLAVRAGGRNLLSVSLGLTLSGPEPWRARGRATFSILFFDVSVGFDVTIGAEPPPRLPERVDVGPLLLAALTDSRAWDAQLPASGQAPVTLREVGAVEAILAHPLGTLQVRQRVAPLERTLERFGDLEPAGARRFAIRDVFLGDDAAETDTLHDLFAPGQFRALSDDEKLGLPSFESMPSGVRIGEEDVVHGPPVEVRLVYEQRPEPASRAGIPDDVLVSLAEPPPAGAPDGHDLGLREAREAVLTK